MMPKFNTRKSAALIATAGLSLMLVGAGLSATFTDSGVVSQSVAVGTFKIELASAAANAVVATDRKSITFTGPAILSSAPGSAPMPFTVKNVGTIPLTVSVAADMTGGSARFSSIALANAPVAPGASHDYVGGLEWAELITDDLERVVSITYTISAQG